MNYIDILKANTEPITLSQMLHAKNLIAKGLDITNKSLEDYTNQEKIIDAMIVAHLEDNDIEDITIEDFKVKLGYTYKGNITSTQDKENFKYLYDTSNEGCIKKKAIIDLDRYPEVVAQLKEIGVNDVEEKYDVHHMTLSSTLKQLIESGEMTAEQMEIYNVYKKPKLTVKTIN